MTSAQADALFQLIAADRVFRSRVSRGESLCSDDRGIEVSALFGIHPKTARMLEAHGLAEMVGGELNKSPWLFLGKFAVYDNAQAMPARTKKNGHKARSVNQLL